jgi:hypothetical protein
MAIIKSGYVLSFVAFILFAVVMWVYGEYSKRGRVPYVKRLPAFDAMEEAVGRAVEMGRPVVMVPGRGSFTDLFVAQTVAGLTVLNYVAGLCARYGVKLWAPMADHLVIPVARENVRDAYAAEGKLDELDVEETLPYVSGSQFAWASSVIGYYARERPAANIMVGAFWAESMMLAESAGRIGALQIGGTARLYQLPFFAAVCDYTLLGEEIFAASAYMTQDPIVITSLATTDVFRLVGWVIIIVGAILSTVGINVVYQFLSI